MAKLLTRLGWAWLAVVATGAVAFTIYIVATVPQNVTAIGLPVGAIFIVSILIYAAIASVPGLTFLVLGKLLKVASQKKGNAQMLSKQAPEIRCSDSGHINSNETFRQWLERQNNASE